MSRTIARSSLSTRQAKPLTIVATPRYVTFQMAEVAVTRELFTAILERIGRLGSQAAARVPG